MGNEEIVTVDPPKRVDAPRSVEEILKRIENVFQVEMDLAKQLSETDTYQTIGYLKREVLAIVGAQRAQLKKLTEDLEKLHYFACGSLGGFEGYAKADIDKIKKRLEMLK